MKNNLKLEKWKKTFEECMSAYQNEYDKMDNREILYRGKHTISPVCEGDKTKEATHLYNIVSELIEAQVDSGIPIPKVTAKRAEDEHLAKLIEDMLNDEMKEINFATLNDILERTVPLQGAGFMLVEWDCRKRTRESYGGLSISYIHPKQVIPQSGIWTSLNDMDYFFICLPQTKKAIGEKYDVDVSGDTEDMPELRNVDYESENEELVTQYIAYYKNGHGGIGAYSWAGDTEIFDYENAQGRRVRHCKNCGTAEDFFDGENGEKCPNCGGTEFVTENEENEIIWTDKYRSDGSVIPARVSGLNNVIPYYEPGTYPLIMLKNVSLYGKFMGDSDADKIADQQNTLNRIQAKIIDKLTKAGSYITLPDEASIRFDTEDLKIIRPGSAASKAMIDVYSLEGNIAQDLSFAENVYEQAKRLLGVTDSFLGRKDETASSGKAKQIAVAQSAGRFESKRTLKRAAYSELFKLMFKLRLAYTDEPVSVLSKDEAGNVCYESFNRYDFLCFDENGLPYWNDDFIFEAESSTGAVTRQGLWEQASSSFANGAFGNKSELDTLIMYWKRMEELHYPGACETRKRLEQKSEDLRNTQNTQNNKNQ